jgi:predicted permease
MSRFRRWWERRGLEQRLERELRDHVDLEAEDQGGNRDAARRALGNQTRIKEETRAEWGGLGLERLSQDVASAARHVKRTPLLSLGVVVTLALGIAATTTIYTIVDGVMLRRLPYEEPSSLVTVGAATGVFVAPDVQDLGPISILYYQQLRLRARAFETLVAVSTRRLMPLPLPDGGETNVQAHEVSSGLFDMLGPTTPVLGRLFLPEEYTTPQEGAVMVAFEEWQSRYGGDPGIIGRTIGRIRGGRFPAVVVGVLPADFHPLEALFASGERPGYYFPRAAELLPEDRGWETWYVLGRLAPGITNDQARSEVERIGAEVAREFPEAIGLRQRNGAPYRLGLNGLHAQTVGANAHVLWVFLGASGLLLALAVMNAATLLLARSLDRVKEFSIRMALGAGRMRIVRLLLCETGMLALASGGVGTLIAYGGVETFLRFAPASIPRLDAIAIDVRALTITAVTSLAAGIAIGLLPALGLTRWGPWQPLQAGGRSFAEPTSPVRTVLVVGQMALAIVLLVGAGLLVNSFIRMRALDPGIEANRLVTVTISYKDTAVGDFPLPQAWDRVLDELRRVPGVQSAAGTTTAPFQTPFWLLRAQLPGDDPDAWRSGIAGYAVTPDYFDTVGTRLVRGRNLHRLDGPESERVALVNESFARTHLQGANPLGTIVRLTDSDNGVRIVGVVEDVVQQRAEEGFRPAIYVPYAQYGGTAFVVAVVRTSGSPDTILNELRAGALRIAPGWQPGVRLMQDMVDSTLVAPRFRAMLIGTFALMATILGAAGLYATIAHFVAHRRRELGIRVALGGDSAHLIRLVLRRTVRLSSSGLVIGVVAALILNRSLSAFLFGVESHDLTTFVLVTVILLLVSASAAVLPARRAAAIDPIIAIKAE